MLAKECFLSSLAGIGDCFATPSHAYSATVDDFQRFGNSAGRYERRCSQGVGRAVSSGPPACQADARSNAHNAPKNGALSHFRPTGLSTAWHRWTSWKSKQKDAPAFQARWAASNNSSVKNTSCFSTTWSSHDCAQCPKIHANLHSPCTVGAKSMDRKFKSAVESIASNCRGVAQPGSAPALGAGGPEFKSRRPDQFMLFVPHYLEMPIFLLQPL